MLDVPPSDVEKVDAERVDEDRGDEDELLVSALLVCADDVEDFDESCDEELDECDDDECEEDDEDECDDPDEPSSVAAEAIPAETVRPVATMAVATAARRTMGMGGAPSISSGSRLPAVAW
ncbi:hypothetical protein [Actinomycetospora chiangmaiensis]|uniref:hypothetical protein n=1 Tax=Actinomycetospora chiangmaiensis TaxID=402650 RepID=UPI0012F9853C|nr:hypothetical protein [Actinomycetospora chiangmaiensis]